MHIAILGASRGCANFAAFELLQMDPDNRLTLLLRKPDAIHLDPLLGPYVNNGRIHVFKGDATVESDVAKLFKGPPVDLVVSGIGGVPSIGLSGIKMASPICTNAGIALANTLSHVPEPKPRVVIISSMGMGGTHHYMPLLHRIIYPWLLHDPHQDKEAYEQILKRASRGWETPELDLTIGDEVLSEKAYEGIPEDVFDQLIIVRPAWLVDGPVTDQMRAAEDLNTWTARRSDVGRFIARECTQSESVWVNRGVIVGF
ncbi:hypothetical protein BD324DRAFT_648653 [Kockovaella imperatae]|uniref:NAD(P)-binding domain-containing protein n=1 Tax=Kockovaella imperatae TaxID=4999 RepID=A0A1Y1UPT3_9TREE|nr:hypothetical protein BD324DRAFT_648653 [Kockovaella imperatae]ORX40041.1 hypothetical protein BD324DRAFT_648653 [Kockovaella imperatae]